jgi:hypothetical protein
VTVTCPPGPPKKGINGNFDPIETYFPIKSSQRKNNHVEEAQKLIGAKRLPKRLPSVTP